jgi:predicted lipoprotein with Yx(FWY)xxD motif
MNTKSIWISVAVVVVLAAAIGSYFIFHKPYKAPASTTSSNSNSTSAVNNSVVITKSNSSVSSYLADPNDNALYTVGSGTTGVDNCMGSCLTAWPPYLDKGAATGLPTNVGTITRSDNSEIQYTYKGMPLYYLSSDTPGQATGNGISGFYLATP